MMSIDDYKDVHTAVSSCRDGRTLTHLREQLPHLDPARLVECLDFLTRDGSLVKVTIRGTDRYLRRKEFEL